MNKWVWFWIPMIMVTAIHSMAPSSARSAMDDGGEVPGIAYGSASSFAEFHGFVDFEYYDFEPQGSRGGRSYFDQHHFYFNAIARIMDKVTVFGEIEYEHGGEEIVIDRAFVDLNLHRDYFNLRAGKFYAPFGLEIQYYQSPVRRLVSRPLIVRPFLFNEWTEVGINAYGGKVFMPLGVGFTYDIAMVNGPGANDGDGDLIPDILESTSGSVDPRQNRDNNSNRTWIGRVSVPVKTNKIRTDLGFSYAGGRYNDLDTEDLQWRLVGVDGHIQLAGLDVRGEYVMRRTDRPTTLGGGAIEGDGYYIQLAYRHHLRQPGIHYLEPAFRYDDLDPNDAVADDEQTQVSFGLNYSPWPHVVVRAEYQTTDETPEKNNDGYLFQVVVDF